jgi:predicted aspartyl protease
MRIQVVRKTSALVILIVVHIISAVPTFADVCTQKSVKSVAFICGSVVAMGTEETVPNARVIVLSHGVAIAETVTGQDGKFALEGLKAGHYQVSVTANGFDPYSFQIVVSRTGQKCKRRLRVTLSVAGNECLSGVVLVGPER